MKSMSFGAPARCRKVKGVSASLTLCLALVSPLASAQTSTQTYMYDGLGRLTSACEANVAATSGELSTYRFDSASNRSSYAHVQTVRLMLAGQGITSPDGRFNLVMQSDGNFVLYGNLGSGPVAYWASSTYGSAATQARFQSDGNLVLYTASGVALWSTNTWHSPCATLSVQNDGNVVITDVAGSIVWQSNTGGH